MALTTDTDRVDDIKEQSVERLQALLKLAPELDQKIRAWLSELDIAEPDWDDYMDFDQVYYLGLATILQQVIEEAEGLRLTACDDSSGATYLIYQPCYPWEITDRERDLTEESLVQMFSRYVNVLSCEPIEVGRKIWKTAVDIGRCNRESRRMERYYAQ